MNDCFDIGDLLVSKGTCTLGSKVDDFTVLVPYVDELTFLRGLHLGGSHLEPGSLFIYLGYDGDYRYFFCGSACYISHIKKKHFQELFKRA